MGKQAPDFDGFIMDGALPPAALPVDLGDRCFCGELDIRIDAWGVWHYNASPIRRKEMTCLFASMLVKDCMGRHWLITPTEAGCIQVDDAPFIAVDLCVHGMGREQTVSLYTNVDQPVTIDADCPLTLRPCPDGTGWAPYVTCDSGLDVKFTRALYYDLVDLAVSEPVNGQETLGIWSAGTFFPLSCLNALR